MALNIKNPEVERLAADVARLTGESKTEAIRRALKSENYGSDTCRLVIGGSACCGSSRRRCGRRCPSVRSVAG